MKRIKGCLWKGKIISITFKPKVIQRDLQRQRNKDVVQIMQQEIKTTEESVKLVALDVLLPNWTVCFTLVYIFYSASTV